ncbi:pantoate--beta-alanine ligase [Flavitalea sp. BT771]|uniref:pantoate--beta-alanine ligase n=1 Tax=Flavitalea sp. BT771 TaxID=3063329 RepID=UPI0026E351FD|nr:pantoate--beta-alanine ligase [Flavitalea sp. BT771]MDO6430119.1 pantoate--beta-alanine ligase [Flavitalea sp. BT771]MDV6219742.1 pantoate--beta-alanine ligase [Flavitalea sp. BT771]
MILLKKVEDLSRWLGKQRLAGESIGFVPTMGALHEGHISLIDISKKTAGFTVCSIFVNPTQFNDPKDFQKYPITIEKDIQMLEKAGTDVLFLPEVNEIYPQGISGLEKYDLGRLESLLEGAFRPGHFQGVCQVMRRLLEAVRADHLFMGQKDYQQCMVVRRLLEIIGLPTLLHPCPIVREADGLAMSSRNLRLSDEQRKKSVAIYQALARMKEGWGEGIWDEGVADISGKIEELTWEALSFLEAHDLRVDYVAIADPVTLEPLAPGQRDAIALVAAFMGEVRLIDNMSLS